jgi:hypothetical protein
MAELRRLLYHPDEVQNMATISLKAAATGSDAAEGSAG